MLLFRTERRSQIGVLDLSLSVRRKRPKNVLVWRIKNTQRHSENQRCRSSNGLEGSSARITLRIPPGLHGNGSAGREDPVIKARQIINRGDPLTLPEVLFIFPEACGWCGFRELSVTFTGYGGAHIYGHEDLREWDVAITCNRCGRAAWLRNIPQGRNSPSHLIVRVYSPYLTRGESDSIPELPFAGPPSSGPAEIP
jgi:hypothetical protein